MRKPEPPLKHTRGEWIIFILVMVVIMFFSVRTSILSSPYYPSDESVESCVSEMERYMQDPYGDVSENFEIIKSHNMLVVKHIDTDIEYICTTKENGEAEYSIKRPVVMFFFTKIVMVLVAYFAISFVAISAFVAVSIGVDLYKEKKQRQIPKASTQKSE